MNFRSSARSSARGRPSVALFASLVLVLTACSGGTDEGAKSGEAGSANESADSVSTPTDSAGTGPVQDVWVYERIRTVSADGGFLDVTSKLADQLARQVDESAAVEMVDGVTFTTLDSLHPRVRAADGTFRDDLDVIAGVVQSGDLHGLQVIATPTGKISINADDMLVLDLPVPGLEPGAPLIVDFAFGQGIPEPEDPGVGKDVSGADLLRQRMADDRFHWYATGDDDSVVPGLKTVLGSVPGVGSPGAAGATVDPALLDRDPAALSVAPAVMTHRSRASVRSVDNHNPGGGIPLKARPTTDAVKDIGDCKGFNIKCISDYFDNMEKGFKKSWDDLMNRNMPPSTPGSRPAKCPNCGGGSGEPHMTTFDGYRYDLQAAGEFTLASGEGLQVQARLSPYGKSTKLAIVTAVAVEVDGHRLSARMDREPLIRLNGKPVSLEEAQLGFKVGEAEALLYADDLTIRTPDGGPAVVLPSVTGGSTDVLVDPGDVENWTGLLGDHDGDPDNDLRPRDGDPLKAERSAEDLYGVFAESWRISAADSLFDYEDGENTETFTDRDFPLEYVDVSNLTEAERAVADTVCSAAGLLAGRGHDDCVFDYAMTGNMEFVRTARRFQALVNGSADGWSQAIPNTKKVMGSMRLDSAEHVLVPIATDDGGLLVALDIEGGTPAWQQKISRSPCLAVTASGQVVVPVPGKEERTALAVLDPTSGRQIATAPTGLRGCSSMTAVGNTVVVQHGDTVLGIDVVAPEVRFELDMPGLQGAPVVSGDGMVWVVRKIDDQVHAEWIDPDDGRPTRVAFPVPNVLKNVAATPDGIVVAFGGGEKSSGGLLRLDASGPRWQTAFPITFAGAEVSRLPSGPLSVSAEHVASHLGDQVGIFDLATGKPIQVIKPSSFSNNGDQQFLLDDVVVVGPFGGKHWVEAWDIGGAELAWSADSPTATGLVDVKRIGPATPEGLVAVAASSDEGVVVSLVGPTE